MKNVTIFHQNNFNKKVIIILRKTHLFLGTFITIKIIQISSLPMYSYIGIIGSTIPDIDYKIGIKHRTITHSLLFVFISTYIVWMFNKNIGIIYCLNCLLHLFEDSITKMGVPFLYPWNKKYYGMKIIKTGGCEDLLFLLIGLYLTLMNLL